MFGFGSQLHCTEPRLHCAPPLFYASVQYCSPTATNTHVWHTHVHFLPCCLCIPPWVVRYIQTEEARLSLNPARSHTSFHKESELCCVLGRASIHGAAAAAMIVSTVHLQLSQTVNLNILVIYLQLIISAVTRALLSSCITACREMMDFSVINPRLTTREDRMESCLHYACVKNTEKHACCALMCFCSFISLFLNHRFCAVCWED